MVLWRGSLALMLNSQRELDLTVACPECGSCVGQDCKKLEPLGFVHFIRRLRRLAKERGMTVEELYAMAERGEVIESS